MKYGAISMKKADTLFMSVVKHPVDLVVADQCISEIASYILELKESFLYFMCDLKFKRGHHNDVCINICF